MKKEKTAYFLIFSIDCQLRVHQIAPFANSIANFLLNLLAGICQERDSISPIMPSGTSGLHKYLPKKTRRTLQEIETEIGVESDINDTSMWSDTPSSHITSNIPTTWKLNTAPAKVLPYAEFNTLRSDHNQQHLITKGHLTIKNTESAVISQTHRMEEDARFEDDGSWVIGFDLGSRFRSSSTDLRVSTTDSISNSQMNPGSPVSRTGSVLATEEEAMFQLDLDA